jgi:hypothetical protein
MNRRYRRTAAKQEKNQANQAAAYAPDGVTPTMPIVGKQASPGLFLRLISRILLSGWVLKRVQHGQVLALLADLAGQVGRTDVLIQIHEKLRQR